MNINDRNCLVLHTTLDTLGLKQNTLYNYHTIRLLKLGSNNEKL